MAGNYVEGIQSLGPGQPSDLALGSYGQQLTSDFWGKYGELVRRGYVYVGAVSAAAAVPIYSTLTNAPSIWNPASSNKVVMPLRVCISLGAIGTPILNGFTASYLINAGDNIGTGAPVVTWTNVAPTNMCLGKGGSATTKFSPAVSTYTTQPAKLIDMGFGHHLEGTAASGQLYSQFYFDFDGLVMMPPGSTLHVGSTIATSTTYWTTIIFAEIPKPQVLN